MQDDQARRLAKRVIPGAALFDDHDTWSPQVPRDLTAPPPAVAANGTAPCEVCGCGFSLAELEITAHGYRCGACVATEARIANPTPADLDNVKVGRGRWWIMPIIFAVGGAFVFVAPAIALTGTLIGAAVVFRLFLRRGI